MSSKKYKIYTLSDATGEITRRLAIAASKQFFQVESEIIQRYNCQTEDLIKEVIEEVKADQAMLIFTIVNPSLRRFLLDLAKSKKVIAIDIMGPLLDTLSHYFDQTPSDTPGLQYRTVTDYFKRMDAIDFTIKHDEGSGLEDLEEADIVLLGISRVSKTPLSIYLANLGFRCANYPVVIDMPIKDEIINLKKPLIVGLMLEPNELMNLRSARLKILGRSSDENYASRENVEKELEFAFKQYQRISSLELIDISTRAIEEIASEIIHLYQKKVGG
jgi:hypothetical protein